MSPKSLLFWMLTAATAEAANIALVKLRNLTFPRAAQGDVAATVTAGSAASAQYTVTGDPGKSYNVTLPASISMTGPGTAIVANTFTSSSVNGYVLNGAGQDTLYVGATRVAIPGAQTAGSYSAIFNTSVRYTSGGKAAKAATSGSLSVIAALVIAKLTDLNFGEAVRGDGAKILDPGNGAGRATFTVTGQPSTAYTITLPGDGTVVMTTNGGGIANRQIAVNTFTSSPASPATLPVGGSQTLGVGATRSAILATQETGVYSATFQVTVTYQ